MTLQVMEGRHRRGLRSPCDHPRGRAARGRAAGRRGGRHDPLVAGTAPADPAGAVARRGGVDPAPQLRRDGPVPAVQSADPAAVRAPGRASAPPQRAAAGRRVRPGLRRAPPRRAGPGGGARRGHHRPGRPRAASGARGGRPLGRRRRDVRGVGVGHRLDDDRRALPRRHRARPSRHHRPASAWSSASRGCRYRRRLGTPPTRSPCRRDPRSSRWPRARRRTCWSRR